MWRYLLDATFSRFDTIPECDGHTHTQTDGHTTTAYTALGIALRGKKTGPDRENSRKYLPFGEKIAKIGPVDIEIALLIVKKIKKEKKKKLEKCMAKPSV